MINTHKTQNVARDQMCSLCLVALTLHDMIQGPTLKLLVRNNQLRELVHHR